MTANLGVFGQFSSWPENFSLLVLPAYTAH